MNVVGMLANPIVVTVQPTVVNVNTNISETPPRAAALLAFRFRGFRHAPQRRFPRVYIAVLYSPVSRIFGASTFWGKLVFCLSL